MKLLTDEMEAEAENWDKYAENDIVKRAKVVLCSDFVINFFNNLLRQCQLCPTTCIYSPKEMVH